MIRTVVVDDDYRVAKVHADSIAHVEGFTCVGRAHSCLEARTMVETLRSDLLLLDLYLPDGHGLDLIRSLLTSTATPRPDFIVITAARDIASVHSAMQLGAMFYLVKPFGFAQLRDQLRAYQRLHEGLEESAVANQQTVDALYDLLRGPVAAQADRGRLPPTMARVLKVVRSADAEVSAAEVADELGVSRATSQRHLADLLRRGHLELVLHYGATGRPEHRFRIAASPR